MQHPEELTRSFRERGLKVTPQRQAVFRAIHDNDRHPTAEAVHQIVVADMPTVSLRTVYQTLNDLADMGEILSLDLGTGAARFDPNIESEHHHLVCEGCGMVRDLHVTLAIEEFSPARSCVLAELPSGFSVSGTHLVVRGLCRECAAVEQMDS